LLAIGSNPDIFKDPSAFNPDRWIGPNSKDMEEWFVFFSWGPRKCVGEK
jgi:cytochrome P450